MLEKVREKDQRRRKAKSRGRKSRVVRVIEQGQALSQCQEPKILTSL